MSWASGSSGARTRASCGGRVTTSRTSICRMRSTSRSSARRTRTRASWTSTRRPLWNCRGRRCSRRRTSTLARSSRPRSRVSISGWGDRSWPARSSASWVTSSPSSSPRLARRASMPPSSSIVDYDPLPAAVDPEQALAGDALLFPESGTNICTSHPAERDESLFDGCEAVVSGRAGQPAAGGVPARAARVRGRRRRRRPADVVALDADPASGSRRPGDEPRPGAGRRARRRARRRRRVRRQDARRRGDPGLLACPPHGSSGPLDRDPQREHGRDDARSRRRPRLHDRGQPGRRDPGLPPPHPAGRRRLSAHRGGSPRLHRADGERRLRDPEDRDRVHVRRHQHDADRPLPRRGPAGGDAGDRAGDGSLRRRDRARSRRGSAPESLRLRRLPPDDGLGRPLRLRRLRGRARPRARDGRVRGAAGRAAAPPRGGRHDRAGNRRQRVRRDHERPRGARVRCRRDHAGGRGRPPHGLVLPRPGARDDLRDDRRGPARPARRGGACRQGRHRRGARRASARTARSRPRSAESRPSRPRAWSPSGPGSWPPSSSRRTSTTSCSTPTPAAST